MIQSLCEIVEIRHFHLFCGLGGGARGFNRGRARVGNLHARFRCLGGIDVSPAAIADFERLAGVLGTCMDLMDREQFLAFHGQEPPEGWREATPEDIRRAAGNERPHIVFLSAPCKGFSGLLSETKSQSGRYQALNRLTVRGVWLMLEAWADDPPELILFENVPRIASRGRYLLDQIGALLRHYGYAVAETTHDCGELGGLAQSRKRFLLVARHREKVPPFLYQPSRRPLRAVGDVLGRMPLPGAAVAGPMHRMPALQWRTWVRLAFVEVGSDWRSLSKLRVVDGMLADYGIIPEREWRSSPLGVLSWDQHCGTVAGRSTSTNGRFSIADPRMQGPCYGKYAVVPYDQPAGTVIGGSTTGQGAFAVADPRTPWNRDGKDAYLTQANFGVIPWDRFSGSVTGHGQHDNGAWSVADPRPTAGDRMEARPAPADRLVAVIRALDGTWHRPFTTLELAALQGLVDPEERLELDGLSDQAWRERIGNAVPPPAAQAIAGVMGTTLLLAWSGERFSMSSEPVWVAPVAAALAVETIETSYAG